MDLSLLCNLVIGALALLRLVLFAVFCRAFREGNDVHPIYSQSVPSTASDAEPLKLQDPVVRAA
jgi:hypothetical protein